MERILQAHRGLRQDSRISHRSDGYNLVLSGFMYMLVLMDIRTQVS